MEIRNSKFENPSKTLLTAWARWYSRSCCAHDNERTGKSAGATSLVFTDLPFIAVCRLKDECIEILHIYHGAQVR